MQDFERQSRYWPSQTITELMWQTWRTHIKKVLLNTDGSLREPLGPWHTFPKDIFFYAIYNATRHLVQIETDGRWTSYRITKKQRRSWKLQALGPSTADIEHFDQQNDDYIPVEIINQNHQQLSAECTIPQIREKEKPKTPDNFLEFLLQQNPATQFLVNDIEIANDNNNIITLCNEHKKEIIASDGGCKTGRGSFGWIIVINEEVVACAKGPAEGCPATISSFRTESYGMLSATTFITGMNKYFDMPLEFQWQIYLDSDALIKRLKIHERKIHPFNLPLSTDYDVTRAVAKRLQTVKYDITHVKSHQDDKKPFASLPKPAQYNVIADQLATEQLQSMKKPRTTTTPIDDTAILVINETTITTKPNHALLEAARLQRQIPFLTHKYGWTKKIFHDIDWDVHQAAIQSFSTNDQTRIIKFILQWLPTGRRQHRETDGMHPAECPLCDNRHEETNTHMLCCTHPEQEIHMQNLYIDLEKLQHDMKSDRHFHEAASSGILQCSYDPAHTPNTRLHDKSVTKLIEKQQEIGWYHILYGRISKSIVQHQENQYRKDNANEKWYTGKRWAVKLITITWKTVLKTWKTRCELVHGRDKVTRQIHAQQTLGKRVTACYNFLPQIAANDRHMFDATASETMQKNPQQIETWLYMVETLIRQIKKEQQNKRNHKPISDYFKKPSHNIHVRQALSKPMKNQPITNFFTPKL